MKTKQHDLLTVEGFNRQFEDNLPGAASYEAAYNATELDFIEQYRHRRYRNYESFRVTRSQWINLRKKKEQKPENDRQAA